jgi:hypothetical protein
MNEDDEYVALPLDDPEVIRQYEEQKKKRPYLYAESTEQPDSPRSI